jgi:hypothetical protein
MLDHRTDSLLDEGIVTSHSCRAIIRAFAVFMKLYNTSYGAFERSGHVCAFLYGLQEGLNPSSATSEVELMREQQSSLTVALPRVGWILYVPKCALPDEMAAEW